MVDEYMKSVSEACARDGRWQHERSHAVPHLCTLLGVRLEPRQRALPAWAGARADAPGHEVRCYEELGSWSLTNLMQQKATWPSERSISFAASFPSSMSASTSGDETLQETLARRAARSRRRDHPRMEGSGRGQRDSGVQEQFGFRALFHDTHHRAYTNAGEILRFQLHLFDGVLAFGEPITRIYLDGFGMPRAWTFHEAADIDNFHPDACGRRRSTCCGSATGATKSARAS